MQLSNYLHNLQGVKDGRTFIPKASLYDVKVEILTQDQIDKANADMRRRIESGKSELKSVRSGESTSVISTLFSAAKSTVMGGYTGDSANLLSRSGIQAMMQSLGRLKTRVLDTMPKAANFINTILASADFIDDSIAEGAEIKQRVSDYDWDHNFLVEITKDDFDFIIEGLEGCFDYKPDIVTANAGFSFTDAAGRCFSLVKTNVAEKPFKWVTHGATVVGDYIDSLIIKIGDRYFFNNIVPTVNLDPTELSEEVGSVVSIWNPINDLSQSHALNECMRTCIEVLQNGYDVAAGFATFATTYVSHKYAVVRNFVTGVSSAYSQGGVYGAVSYIIAYANQACKVQSADGKLIFTDNKAFIPQEYIAGFISKVLTAVVQFASIIAGIFSKVLGALGLLVSALISAPWKSASYDWEHATKSLLNLGPNAIIPAAPYGIFQVEFDDTSVVSRFAQVLSDRPILAIEIPGGFILVGPGSYNLDGSLKSVRAEAHPAIISKDSVVSFIRGEYPHTFLTNYFDYEFDGAIGSDYVRMGIKPRDVILSMGRLSPSAIAECWASSPANEVNYSVESTDDAEQVEMSNDEMAACRLEILKNIAIMHMFFYLMVGGGALDVYKVSTFRVSQVYHASGERAVFLAPTGVSPDSISMFWLSVMTPPTGRPVADERLFIDSTESYDFYLTNNQPDLGYLITPTQNFIERYDWIVLGTLAVNFQLTHTLNAGPDPSYAFFLYGINEYINLPSKMVWAIQTPKYNAKTFWKWVTVSTIATVAVAAVAVGSAIAAKKYIQTQQLKNNLKVEAAWDRAKNNPTDENIAAYRTACKKANLQAKIIGGTTYDRAGYWNTGSSDPASPSSTNIFSSYGFENYSDIGRNDSISVESVSQSVTLFDVLNVIKGVQTVPQNRK